MSIVAVADVLTYLGKNATATDAERGLVQMLIPLAEGALRKFLGYNPEQAERTEFYPDSDQYAVEDDSYDVINNRIVGGGMESDSRIITLQHLPVRSIYAVDEDMAAYAGQGANDFAAPTRRVLGTDYYLDVGQSGLSESGFLVRIGGCWPSRRRTVRVIYTAGYTAAELDGSDSTVDAQALKFAAILAVAAAFQEHRTWQAEATAGGVGPLQSESINTSGHSVTYAVNTSQLSTGMIVRLPPKAQALAQPFRRYRV